ncbi:P-loop containing nucleoside triphosphate hydrolase protein [Mycena floridula]|nr:P-loop containing nucleoside triphosphate hydrolase protein [Mycena floridula]
MSPSAFHHSDNPTNKDVEGVGLSNPQLSQGRRKMLDLVNRLHSTGVQVDIDLPQIAVVGSQSAGKSSLIESISGITLPRASGTCTRAPTECRLSRSNEPWKCIVSLQRITDAQGQALAQVRNKSFGPTIFDKALVEERIRRAQRAILNPTTSTNIFLAGDDEDPSNPELTFTTNYISLQISGPDVADLSFCDLPGLIASGNETDIQLIRSLVSSYISKPSCVILLTVACETDFQNQGAQQLAKEHDPQGKRTIGVLTKPDRIPAGDENTWLSLIRNEEEPLENNWYCVKQPSSTDLKQGITWEEARSRENSFFLSTPPWTEVDPMYQKYLRTSNLLVRLSKVLSDLISKRLPQIKQELDASIEKAEYLMYSLPKEPSKEPLYDIANLLSEFSKDLNIHISGIPGKEGLLQQIRGPQEHFRRAIQKTAPDFRPYERRSADRKTFPKFSFLSTEESESEEEQGDTSEVGSNDFEGRRRGPIFIDEVIKKVSESRSRELPTNYPYVVHEEFIGQFIVQWKDPALRLSRQVHDLTSKYVDQLVMKHFSAFGQRLLEQRVRVLIQSRLEQRLEVNQAQIHRLIELESQPFTLNTHYLSDYKEKFISYYKAHRQRDIQVVGELETYTAGSNSNISNALSALNRLGIQGLKAIDLVKLLPTDSMEPAIDIMAQVRAYFQVAYKRFADNVPLAIDLDLVRGVEKDVLRALQTGLKIYGQNGSEICKELAEESPQVAERRLELAKKLERLREARKELLEAMI